MAADQMGLALTEEEKKRQAWDRMEASEKRADVIAAARTWARKEWRRRDRENDSSEPTTITTDPVRRFVERYLQEKGVEEDEEISRNLMGVIFRGDHWKHVGYTKSTIEGSHSNIIYEWTLAEEEL